MLILITLPHLLLSLPQMDTGDIFDSNFNYEQHKSEKKQKGGRLRALRRMTQNAAKIATDMTRLVTGQDLIKKAIQNRHYEEQGSELQIFGSEDLKLEFAAKLKLTLVCQF